MKVGVTGHQNRPTIDWRWVSATLEREIAEAGMVERAYSALAVGTDQIFAEIVIGMGIPLEAVIPIVGYESYFSKNDVAAYKKLLNQSEPNFLLISSDPETAFLEAGRYIVRSCDLLLAVWDGKRAQGRGGTGDIVQYAVEQDRDVVHLNVLSKKVRKLSLSQG